MTGLNYVRLLWGCDSGVGTDGGAPTARKGIATGRDPVGSRPISRAARIASLYREPVSRARITSPYREPISRARITGGSSRTVASRERPVARARMTSGPYHEPASQGLLAHCRASRPHWWLPALNSSLTPAEASGRRRRARPPRPPRRSWGIRAWRPREPRTAAAGPGPANRPGPR